MSAQNIHSPNVIHKKIRMRYEGADFPLLINFSDTLKTVQKEFELA